MKKEEKMLHRIIAQSNDNSITISAETREDVTQNEAVKMVKKDVLRLSSENYSSFIVQPICTKEQWEQGTINFCPRCGKRLEEPMENGGDWDCFDCGAHVEAYVLGLEE